VTIVSPPRLLLLLGLALAWPATAASQQEKFQMGSDILIEAGETVGDVACLRCSVRVLGRVNGDVAAIGGHVEVEGEVSGDVAAIFGNIRLGPDAEVGGDAAAILGRVERDPGARIRGEVTAIGPGLASLGLFGLLLLGLVLGLVLTLLLCLLSYAVLGERRVNTMALALRERGALAWLAGLGVVVFAILLFVISAYLGPATPVLATVTAVMLFVTAIVGYTGVGFWVGRGVAKNTGPVAALLIGLLLICVLQGLPFVGLLAALFFGPLALGAAAMSGFGTAPDWLPRQFSSRAVPPAPPAVPPSAVNPQ
jgi:cytoskeletal protein CcmA (bactofilin family)